MTAQAPPAGPGADTDVDAATVSTEPWDLVVIGGGTAGIVGSTTAAGLGARVLLVERARTGGDCLWTGCVPSKALLAAAHAAAAARSAGRLGVHVGRVDVDFAAVMQHVHAAVAHIAPVDSPESLQAQGVHVVQGDATLTGPTTLTVDGRPHRFRQALVATGAGPTVPDIPGLLDPLTSDTVWGLTELPADLVVLGAGSIGCELGQALARLGARVTLVEAGPRILPREDPYAGALLAAALTEDGVSVRTGTTVRRVQGRTVVLDDGCTVEADRVLVTTGRTARTAGLGLQAAGVRVDEEGFVVTDPWLRTSNPRIWAAGDVTDHPQFTHTAGINASVAATNAVLGLRRRVPSDHVPRVTFTQPEVGSVGVPTDPPPPGMRVLEWRHTHADRAVADGEVSGTSRIVVDRRGRIRGAGVVGPRAGETLGELSVAVTRGLRPRDLLGVIHAYPTYNDAPWNAAIEDVKAGLRTPAARRGLGALVAARRWRLDRGR